MKKYSWEVLESQQFLYSETMSTLTSWSAAIICLVQSLLSPCFLQPVTFNLLSDQRDSQSLCKSHEILTVSKHIIEGLTSLIPSYLVKYMTRNKNLRLVVQIITPDARIPDMPVTFPGK